MTLDLDGLERVASAATPGPWRVRTNRHTTTSGEEWGWVSHVTTQNISLPGMSINWEAPTGRANATHIAVFNPVTVLALLARARDAERLREALGRLRAASTRANVRRVIADRVDEYPEDFDPGDRQEIRDMLADANAELCAAEEEATMLLSALNEGGPANG